MDTCRESRRWNWAGLAAGLGLACAVLSGCNDNKAGKGTDAAELYKSGRMSEAYTQASKDAAHSSGKAKDRAALIAGLSAHAQQRDNDALKWLRPLVTNDDPDIAGRAAATVGLINADQDLYNSAVSNFAIAAQKLKGEDAAKANFYLGESYAALGRNDAATNAYRAALAGTNDPRLKREANDRLSLDAYTIQIGAFSDMSKAQRIAAAAQPRAARVGLPAPRIVSRNLPDGRFVYLVQVGTYKSKAAAAADRLKLGTDAVVARAASR